jgi:GT2 family glycosyltransferase
MTDPDNPPLWSVMIPTFNPRLEHLEQALRSVLMQAPGAERMQIEVVDDCSPDVDVAALVKGVAGERVEFSRNAKNLGLADGWNSCVERAHGVWVHILHQDDYVLPGFYDHLEQTQSAHPDVSLVATRCFIVDDDGCIEEATPRVRGLENGGRSVECLFYHSPLRFPGIVVRKSFYEHHGGFRIDLTFTLDMEMWVRAISNSGGVISSRILACYRNTTGNATSSLIRSGEALRDELRMNRIFKQEHPGFDLNRANRIVCRYAAARAESFARIGDQSAANANLKFWKDNAPISLRLERMIMRIGRKAVG